MTARRAYAAHEALVAPARARAAIWRLIVGLAVVGGVALGLNLVLRAALLALAPGFWSGEMATAGGPGQTPASMLVVLGSFGFVILGTMMAARYVHDRAPLGVIGPMPVTLIQFWKVLRLLAGLALIVLVLPPYDMGAPLVENLDFATWALLLPLSLVAVLIQVSSEEILFRGYIQQALAARFSSPAVWMILPAALFALGHYLPEEAGDNALAIALWAGAFSVLMADLTARAGTLGPAIAVHLVNNVVALLFISLPDSLSGLSLYTLPYAMSDTGQLRIWLVVDFAVIVICWLAARLAIRR